MAKIPDILDAVEADIGRANTSGAEQRLRSLFDGLGRDEINQWRPEIERLIGMFFKKRKRSLAEAFQSKLFAFEIEVDPAVDDPIMAGLRGLRIEPEVACGPSAEGVRAELDDLAQFHLFQWSTFYRDWVDSFFDRMQASTVEYAALRPGPINEVVSLHVQEIFHKGFRYKVEDQRKPETIAQAAAMGGLQRFAELGLERYSTGAMKLKDRRERQKLRHVCSGYLLSALSGFANCQFGTKSGAQLMAANRLSWMHYLPFLTADDTDELAQALGAGTLTEMLSSLVRPATYAIDRVAAIAGGDAQLPHIAQYFHDQRKLEILLHSPRATERSQQLELVVLLDSQVPALVPLNEAEGRGVKLVVCGLMADVASSPTAERLQNRLVNVLEAGSSQTQVAERAAAILTASCVLSSGGRSSDDLVEYNFARTFPLNNPFQSKYFHVVRRSVRNLLRDIEGNNGVRLWCSVRRSGKSTACYDLGGALPSSDVVVQTCDTATGSASAGRIFDAIVTHLTEGTPIPTDFFRGLVDDLRTAASPHSRTVLILDEYETLFGRLRSAANRNDDLRYTVIYPLLGQMVAFSRENMIVFVGQRPNAHYILMDQNPLSAYVRQDSFPLFSHHSGSTSGEFSDLVTRVLTERFSFTGLFLDALHKETAGHPFLTVNVLVGVVDWMIASGVRVKDVRFDQHAWNDYSSRELANDRIVLSTEFQFFIEAAADAMSEGGLRSSPWLWSVYRSMRHFVDKHGALGGCTVSEFRATYGKFGLHASGVSADEVLRTGSDANFFAIDEDCVRMRIPILARIAAAATPRFN